MTKLDGHDRHGGKPATLSEFAGAKPEAARLDESVLVIIDAQAEYDDGGGLPLTSMGAAVAETKVLLALARHHAVPVIHVVHHGAIGDRLFDPEGTMVAILPDLEPAPVETIVVKSMPNAFVRTPLQASIDKMGRRALILCGFMTHNCVGATARGAVDLGYRVTIVASATATRDLSDPLGQSVGARIVQRVALAELAELADRYAVIVATPTCLDPAVVSR